MKDNTAQEPQTIWWNDSAYIILGIFQRGEILSKAAVYLYFFFFFFNEEVGVEAEENHFCSDLQAGTAKREFRLFVPFCFS